MARALGKLHACSLNKAPTAPELLDAKFFAHFYTSRTAVRPPPFTIVSPKCYFLLAIQLSLSSNELGIIDKLLNKYDEMASLQAYSKMFAGLLAVDGSESTRALMARIDDILPDYANTNLPITLHAQMGIRPVLVNGGTNSNLDFMGEFSCRSADGECAVRRRHRRARGAD